MKISKKTLRNENRMNELDDKYQEIVEMLFKLREAELVVERIKRSLQIAEDQKRSLEFSKKRFG